MKTLLAVIASLGLVSCGIDNEVHDPNAVELPPHTPSALVNPETEDVFHEPTPQPVDVLLVIDKSCSMVDDAVEMGKSFPAFIEYMDELNLDYHIGLISTSNDEERDAGKLVSFFGETVVTPQTYLPGTVLAAMNAAATFQGEGEAGIDAVYAAMGPRLRQGENKEFFRHGVPLQIVTITDEEDQSVFWTQKQLVNRLYRWMSEQQTTVYYSAILTMPESTETCGYQIYEETIGYRYLEVVERVNGIAIDICQNDWSVALNAIADYATPDALPEYMLKEHPVVESIQVLVERGPVTLSFEAEGDWIFNSAHNSVWINSTNGTAYEHQKDDVVKIVYTIDYY